MPHKHWDVPRFSHLFCRVVALTRLLNRLPVLESPRPQITVYKMHMLMCVQCGCVCGDCVCVWRSEDVPFHIAPRCVRQKSSMTGFVIVGAQTMDPGYRKHLCQPQTYFFALISVTIISLTPEASYPSVPSFMRLN